MLPILPFEAFIEPEGVSFSTVGNVNVTSVEENDTGKKVPTYSRINDHANSKLLCVYNAWKKSPSKKKMNRQTISLRCNPLENKMSLD